MATKKTTKQRNENEINGEILRVKQGKKKQSKKELNYELKYLREQERETNRLEKKAKEKYNNSVDIVEKNDAMRELLRIKQKHHTREIKQVKAKIEAKTVVQFKNTDVYISTGYLERLKNPQKTILNLYERKTLTQIKRLIDSNSKTNEANGLIRLLLNTKIGAETAEKLRKFIDKCYERRPGATGEKYESLMDTIDQIDEQLAESNYEDAYDLLVTGEGNFLSIQGI